MSKVRLRPGRNHRACGATARPREHSPAAGVGTAHGVSGGGTGRRRQAQRQRGGWATAVALASHLQRPREPALEGLEGRATPGPC